MPTLAPTVHERLARRGNVRGSLSSPQGTVGGDLIERLAVALDGRTLRGVLPRRPSSTDGIVDHGFARAKLGG